MTEGFPAKRFSSSSYDLQVGWFFPPRITGRCWLKLGKHPKNHRPPVFLETWNFPVFFFWLCFFGSAVGFFFGLQWKKSLSLSLFRYIYTYIFFLFFLPRVFWYCWRWNTGIPQYPRWCPRTLKVGGLPLQGGKLHSYLIPMGKDVSFYSDLFIYQLPPWVSSRSYWAMYFHVNGAPFFRQNIAPSVQWNVTTPQVLVLEISRFFPSSFGAFSSTSSKQSHDQKQGGKVGGKTSLPWFFEFWFWYLRRYDTLNNLWETPEPFWFCLLLDM